MACEQFRFLIQQQFDLELPPQDENQLSAHLSQCEACERFHFQMDQIIRTAGDLDLPEEATPENLESLARIIIQQLPKPKSGPLSFLTNLFAGKAKTKEPPKASHAPKSSSRFPHVRRNQSTTNAGAEDTQAHSEDHSQSMSTTLSGRFGRGAVQEQQEPEAPLTLADSIRRKVHEEQQSLSAGASEMSEPPAQPDWPSADANMPPMPPAEQQPFPQANFQEDNKYAPAGGTWEEPAWSAPPPVPTAPPETPTPSPLSSIDLMGQTGDTQANAWASNTTPPPTPQANAPSDLEKGLWQAQQQQPKSWSDEAEQLETGFWQAFTPESGSALSGPGSPAPGAGAPPPPPVPMPTSIPPIPPPVPPSPLTQAQPANPELFAPTPTPAQQDVVTSRFDIPIQERMAMSQSQTPPVPTPAAPPPPLPPENLATPEAAGSQQTNEPQSIISRLSSILGDTPEQSQSPQLMSEHPNQGAVPNMDFGQQSGASPANIPTSPSPPVPEPLTQAAVPSPPPVPVAAPLQPAPQTQSVPVQAAAAPQPVKQAPPAQPVAQPAAAQTQQGLFNVDQSAIDKIFSENLGIVDSAGAVNQGQPVTNQAVQAAPQPAPIAPPPPAPQNTFAQQAPVQQAPAAPVAQPQPVKQEGLFADMDDTAIDQLFSSNLGISEGQIKSQAQPIPQPIPAAPPLPPPVPPPVQPQPTTPAIQQPALDQVQLPEPPQVVTPPPPPQPIASQPVEASQPAPTQQAPAPPIPEAIPQTVTPPPYQAQAQADGMLNVTESDLDKLFSENLGVSNEALSSAPKVNLTQAVETIRQATSTPAQAAPPKIEGVGRLSKNIDTTQDSSSGKISSIGKFLLDQKDLAKLGKVASSNLSSTDMRVLTMEAAQELQNLLGHIGSQPGVAGSVIVGHDGILIANNLPAGHDAESVGVWALGIFLNTENTIKMLGHNHVFQMVARTPQGFLVIADFGGGILVTVSQSSQTHELIPLMRTITQLVAQTPH